MAFLMAATSFSTYFKGTTLKTVLSLQVLFSVLGLAENRYITVQNKHKLINVAMTVSFYFGKMN